MLLKPMFVNLALRLSPKLKFQRRLQRLMLTGAIALPLVLVNPIPSRASSWEFMNILFDLLGAANSGDALYQEALENAETAWEEFSELYGNISAENWYGILGQTLDLLVEYGILDPAQIREILAENRDLDAPHTGIQKPTFPLAIFEHQRGMDGVDSHNTQNLVRSVLGESGQAFLEQELTNSVLMAELSLAGQEGAMQLATNSVAEADTVTGHGAHVAVLSELAKTRTDSQDILKDLAAQNAAMAHQSSGLSNQLAHLSGGNGALASQLQALQRQSQIQSHQLIKLQVLNATQAQQLVAIENGLQQQHHYDLTRDRMDTGAMHQSSQYLFIPGLFAP